MVDMATAQSRNGLLEDVLIALVNPLGVKEKLQKGEPGFVDQKHMQDFQTQGA